MPILYPLSSIFYPQFLLSAPHKLGGCRLCIRHGAHQLGLAGPLIAQPSQERQQRRLVHLAEARQFAHELGVVESRIDAVGPRQPPFEGRVLMAQDIPALAAALK